ncbi:MAG: DUF3574 domain-containing protein [Alphaproteobacteria bacterium]|nr:MAG: DUF3574 domain-containing protein [Alphaproteobacteria bacterium]
MPGRDSGVLGEQAAALAALLLLAGCAASPAQSTPPSSSAPYVCLLPAEQRMLVAELFFDLSVKGREPLTDAEWAEFAAQTITLNFPDGFTVFDGEGQWRNPQTGRIARNRTKILLVAAPRTPDLARRLSAVIDAYKVRFHHQSVGVITRDSCAAF